MGLGEQKRSSSRHSRKGAGMTCTFMGNMIVCTNPWGRLHVNGRYIYLEFHEYCGPSFSYDQAGNKPYEPVDENDPVWPAFDKWLTKYRAAINLKHRRLKLKGPNA